MDAGRERIQGARPKRKPTTKRSRSTRDYHADPLQSKAMGNVNTTVSVPKLPPPAVPAVAKENALSETKTQATGTRARPQSSDALSMKKAAPDPDHEPAHTMSDIAVVPISCLIEKCTSAGWQKEHSMLGISALRFLQSAVDDIKDVCTPSPREQRNKRGTRRQDKAKDRQDKNNVEIRRSSKIDSKGVTGNDEDVQGPIATYLVKTQTTRTPDSDMQAESRMINVPRSPNDQAIPVIGTTISKSVRRRLKRKKRAHDL